jgi:hypothetical protein
MRDRGTLRDNLKGVECSLGGMDHRPKDPCGSEAVREDAVSSVVARQFEAQCPELMDRQ